MLLGYRQGNCKQVKLSLADSLADYHLWVLCDILCKLWLVNYGGKTQVQENSLSQTISARLPHNHKQTTTNSAAELITRLNLALGVK